MQTMQRFLKENYQKNLSLKFIRINNVMHLGGTDFISFNFYLTNAGENFKPCEMPEEKVLEFLNNYSS
jgi:hypothetical protein